MATYFARIFWGLLLVILHFKINGFDLLVDGLGYLIIANGCRGLREPSAKFGSTSVLCYLLAACWLIGFAIPGRSFFSLFVTALNCGMIWQLLGGISDFASERNRADLAERAHSRRVAYVAIVVVTNCLAFGISTTSAATVALVLVLATLVVSAMILHLIHRVKLEVAS